MRLSQRLIEENKKVNREKRRASENRQEPDEDVETYIYDQPPKWGYLNDTKGVFKGDEGDGINTQPDVFERTAIFHTKPRDTET